MEQRDEPSSNDLLGLDQAALEKLGRSRLGAGAEGEALTWHGDLAGGGSVVVGWEGEARELVLLEGGTVECGGLIADVIAQVHTL